MPFRERGIYVILLLGTIGLGLLSRSGTVPASSFFGQYSGDTLWAMAAYWLVGTLMPRHPTWLRLLLTFIFCFSIEISQLYHTDWIDQLRSYRLGGLILGFHFLWSDLVCYFVGSLLAALIDNQWLYKTHAPS